MDKKEILDILNNAKDERGAVPMRLVRQAFDKLVQPEERTEKRTETHACDLISLQAAIDALDCISGVEEVLRSLPPAQPEPHEGCWIDKGWDGDWAWQIDGRGNCWRVIECSECGKGVLVESNYCPHCGAKMKGAEHETN